MRQLTTWFGGIDWWLISAVFLLSVMGLITMYTFDGDNYFFKRQILWICIAFGAFFVALVPDYRFLRTGNTTFVIYLATIVLLTLVLFFGEIVKGAQSRFDLGLFSFQPSDPAKLALIALLAKYFSKRHELIGDFKYIIVSGAYAFLLVGLLFLQPDFGSAIILVLIWLGMILISGIKVRHLVVVGLLGAITFLGLWNFGFQEYQKERIMTFIHPLADIQGAGYNAYQSTIAVGSGQLFGKGVGYGTQSKLQFLPEYETDFIFAAYAEEWGLVGVMLLFALFAVVIWRILRLALRGDTNFERMFSGGVAILLISHFFVHIGMNIGLLPVTGTTIPFLSYGGSHLLTELIGIGMVVAMGRYTKEQYVQKDFLE